MLHGQKHRFQIYSDHPVPLFRRTLFDSLDQNHPGVVHQMVHAMKARGDLIERRNHVRFRRYVRPIELASPAGRPDLCAGGVAVFFFPIEQRHARALPGHQASAPLSITDCRKVRIPLRKTPMSLPRLMARKPLRIQCAALSGVAGRNPGATW